MCGGTLADSEEWRQYEVPFCQWQALICRRAKAGGPYGGGDAARCGGRRCGVKLVRGPFVRLAAHADECADTHAFLSYATRLRAEGAHLARTSSVGQAF